MKWFATYLPQFHEVKENNEWWGKGFTEWTHVKAAHPLFKGHQQPIAPENGNYYDLMDKETVKWQTQLMKEYGIHGFLYYHYYFCGRKLLEKPAENLLKWTDIDQPFFFCWANHSWFKAENGVKTLLIEQKYGTEKEWEEHFQYLLSFFLDSRYEKKDNKPLFMIYKPEFSEISQMFEYFDKRCKDYGFAGIYVIETFSDGSRPENIIIAKEKMCKQTELLYIREPSVSSTMFFDKQRHSLKRLTNKILKTLARKNIISWVDTYNGNALYDIMCGDDYPRGDKICHGATFSWDNTPRHGKRGYIITPPSKEKFMKYADTLKDEEYAFLNAWNEWAEGMILEPTEQDGCKYLSWIKEWNDKNGFGDK